METYFMFIATFALILHLVEAQNQAGFISVDCGLDPSDSPYNETETGLTYTSDAGLINSGKTGRIAKEYEAGYNRPSWTLRYFPDGIRNCYNLNVTNNTNYLIKAGFVYGNYDGLNTDPKFDLYFGPNIWSTVSSNNTIEEIIHVTKTSLLQVCLVKTGISVPYINGLELRPLSKTDYVTQGGSLKYLWRAYFSKSGKFIRYPDDIYDRKWYAYFEDESWRNVTTTQNISSTNGYALPQGVLGTGAMPLNANTTLNITWDADTPTSQVYSYKHFAELETLQKNNTREFNVSFNGKHIYGPYSPKPLQLKTIFDIIPDRCDGGTCILQLVKTRKSTLPPLINAIESFSVINFTQVETNEDDVASIKSIQNTYGLQRISWQGDPCVPKDFSWDGLNCGNLDISTPPIIISLDLSSSGLTGIIAQAIQNLSHLQNLDLSNNSLTGEVPEFLANIRSLLVINLSGNNFSGKIPKSLLQKNNLKLNVEGNPHICIGDSCVNKKNDEHKKRRIIVPMVSSLASLVVFIGALVMFFVFIKKRQSPVQGSQPLDCSPSISSHPATIRTKKRKFTYSEVIMMTNNFQRILGRGGFGSVYHGIVNGTEQVAVKILSESSSQGYKQFKAEVELLLRVHHKNLVGLVGYCDEGEKLAVIYEYMDNGDLKQHMSGSHDNVNLNWGARLKIVVESAQGIEYLHNGCKPPMIHRDIKTTNILLNEHFEGKISDFGLSRSVPIEGESYVSTNVAGTTGYLDPEYYTTNWFTEKSDVYSFGIVLLEIITNQHVIDQSRENPYIPEWVGSMLKNGDITKIMDPNLKGDYDSGSVWRTVEVAMSCVNPSSTKRPTMSQVVIELNECLASENSRGEASRNMCSTDVNTTFTTEINPSAR